MGILTCGKVKVTPKTVMVCARPMHDDGDHETAVGQRWHDDRNEKEEG